MKTKEETKNKTEIIISTIEHSERMREGVGSWGNGYLEIPKEHFSYDYVMDHIDDWGFCGSLCNEDITYDTLTDTGVKIGFDTLHSYNNESHDEQWVLAKCNEIKDYLNKLLPQEHAFQFGQLRCFKVMEAFKFREMTKEELLHSQKEEKEEVENAVRTLLRNDARNCMLRSGEER